MKEICFSLNNTPVKGSELGPVVNKDLSRRAWSVNSMTNDKKVGIHILCSYMLFLYHRFITYQPNRQQKSAITDTFIEAFNMLYVMEQDMSLGTINKADNR